jgi:hypothetical protein
MGRAKEIIVKVIPAKIANEFVKKWHYSGKVCSNSRIHFGCFLDNKLHGVLQYGSSIDKSKIQGLVQNSGWNDFAELNRMAFDEYLPKNSESFCIATTLRLIKKNAPQVKWVISFADGCSCGDGTIYRAANFYLTDIRKNHNLCELPSGEKIHKMTLEGNPKSPRKELNGKSYYDITLGKYDFNKYVKEVNGKILNGFQLRYIYLIDKSCKITVPILPFSKIDEMGAGMYKGKRISIKERNAVIAQIKCAELSSSEMEFTTT